MEELKEEMDEGEDAAYQQTQSIFMALEAISTRIGAGGVQGEGASKGAEQIVVRRPWGEQPLEMRLQRKASRVSDCAGKGGTTGRTSAVGLRVQKEPRKPFCFFR